MQEKRNKPTKETIIRTVILVLAIINNALEIAGKSPLPIESEAVKSIITILFTAGAALAAWWKNNSFTPPAIEADVFMREIRDGEIIMKAVANGEIAYIVGKDSEAASDAEGGGRI